MLLVSPCFPSRNPFDREGDETMSALRNETDTLTERLAQQHRAPLRVVRESRDDFTGYDVDYAIALRMRGLTREKTTAFIENVYTQELGLDEAYGNLIQAWNLSCLQEARVPFEQVARDVIVEMMNGNDPVERYRTILGDEMSADDVVSGQGDIRVVRFEELRPRDNGVLRLYGLEARSHGGVRPYRADQFDSQHDGGEHRLARLDRFGE